MLYQINKTTWLDLPRWKCRREFAELWSAKHTPKQDVELINRLKAQCDEIEREHMASMSRRAEGCRKTGQKLRGRRYNWVHPAAKAVNVYE